MSQNLSENLLVRLGICNKEDIVSNLLADLLKEPSFLEPWLEYAGLSELGSRRIEVKTRINILGNIPDLIVMVSGDGQKSSLLVIENKILATEGDAQTHRYDMFEVRSGLASSFGISEQEFEFCGLYLSLHDEADKNSFKAIRYQQIHPWLLALQATSKDSTRALLARDLAQVLQHFHTHDWDAQESILEVLHRDQTGLAKSYLSFRQICSRNMQALPPAGQISRDVYYWRGVGPGHSYYGGNIETDCSKNGWYKSLNRLIGKPIWSKTTIFFQYTPQANRMKLAVHFATEPYASKAKQAALFQGSDDLRTIHEENRVQIRARINASLPAGWRMNNRYLQIAVADLEVTSDTTVLEFQERFHKHISSMIPVLDNAWKEVRA